MEVAVQGEKVSTVNLHILATVSLLIQDKNVMTTVIFVICLLALKISQLLYFGICLLALEVTLRKEFRIILSCQFSIICEVNCSGTFPGLR